MHFSIDAHWVEGMLTEYSWTGSTLAEITAALNSPFTVFIHVTHVKVGRTPCFVYVKKYVAGTKLLEVANMAKETFRFEIGGDSPLGTFMRPLGKPPTVHSGSSSPQNGTYSGPSWQKMLVMLAAPNTGHLYVPFKSTTNYQVHLFKCAFWPDHGFIIYGTNYSTGGPSKRFIVTKYDQSVYTLQEVPA